MQIKLLESKQMNKNIIHIDFIGLHQRLK